MVQNLLQLLYTHTRLVSVIAETLAHGVRSDLRLHLGLSGVGIEEGVNVLAGPMSAEIAVGVGFKDVFFIAVHMTFFLYLVQVLLGFLFKREPFALARLFLLNSDLLLVFSFFIIQVFPFQFQ